MIYIFDWSYILYYIKILNNIIVTFALVIVFHRKVPPRIDRAFIVNLFYLVVYYAEF